jgi:hypothetical protein
MAAKNMTPIVVVVILVFLIGLWIGYSQRATQEHFIAGMPVCSDCSQAANSCTCAPGTGAGAGGGSTTASRLVCPPCAKPDLSKYILKSSIPAPTRCPDLSNYMLKTECPPVADLSKYVLKSSIPKQQPVIIDNSSCKKEAGECPPCPRARCPEVKCPAPTVCPAPAPCPRSVCPPQTVKCKAESADQSTVRPFMVPLSMGGFGM